ncbi:MAG: hypothetical protein PVI59_16820 [Anaerolineae bacterium]|jgi:hypothetical protein
MPEATIASFILRFTQEATLETEPSGGAWRGVIRHVQTNEEIRFAQVADALAFIARYIDIGEEQEAGIHSTLQDES